jgi:hypothetical protein
MVCPHCLPGCDATPPNNIWEARFAGPVEEMEEVSMLFVLWYEFDPSHTHSVLELWKHFTYPPEVKVINRYLLIGRHMSVAIFEAPSEESLIKITAPFSNFGVAHIAPAMQLEDAIRVKW